MSSWQKKVLCRYFMVGACQAGHSCPYSHDRNISNKGTLPCRFYQAGTCANGNHCRSDIERLRERTFIMDIFRFSHGEADPVQHLSLQMESFAFDQSEAGSEGSYDTSLGSYEDSNYNMLVEPGYLETGMLDPSAPTFYSAWASSSTPSLVSVLPTQQYCDHSNTLEVRSLLAPVL